MLQWCNEMRDRHLSFIKTRRKTKAKFYYKILEIFLRHPVSLVETFTLNSGLFESRQTYIHHTKDRKNKLNNFERIQYQKPSVLEKKRRI